MLGAGEEIAPDLGGRLDVRPAGLAGREVVVGEPRVPAPVLRRGVGVDDLRHALLRAQPVEEPLPSPRARVRLRLVGEREAVTEARGRLHRGLSVAVVELPAPPPRDVDVHPVEHRLTRLVAIETGMEEGPEEPAALRDPLCDHVVDAAGGRRIDAPPRPRGEVAHCEEPRPDHRALGRGVDEVVDAPGLEAVGEGDPVRAGGRPALVPALERPPLARDAYRRVEQVLAHEERGLRLVRIEGRDRRVVADRADVVVGEGEGAGRAVRLDAKLHPAGRNAPREGYAGGAETEAHRGVRNVPLPPAPRDAPPALEQETVADRDLVGRHEVERRHVERSHREPVAPVRHLEEEGAVGPPGVHRHEEGGIAAEADAAVPVPLGPVEVDDTCVRGVAGVHRVVRDGVDPLVGSRLCEPPAAREWLAPHDLEFCHRHLDPPSNQPRGCWPAFSPKACSR